MPEKAGKDDKPKLITSCLSIIFVFILIFSIYLVSEKSTHSEQNSHLILEIYGISIFLILIPFLIIEIMNFIIDEHFNKKECRKIRMGMIGLMAFSLPLPIVLAFSFSPLEMDRALSTIRFYYSLAGLFILLLYNLVVYYKYKPIGKHKNKERDISKGMFWRKV